MFEFYRQSIIEKRQLWKCVLLVDSSQRHPFKRCRAIGEGKYIVPEMSSLYLKVRFYLLLGAIITKNR